MFGEFFVIDPPQGRPFFGAAALFVRKKVPYPAYDFLIYVNSHGTSLPETWVRLSIGHCFTRRTILL